jgi:DNA-binding beta-propeller fold protein YncE
MASPTSAVGIAALSCATLAFAAMPGCAGSGTNADYYSEAAGTSPLPLARSGVPLEAKAVPLVSVRRARSSAEVFVSDSLDNVVKGYDQRTGDLVLELTGFNTPEGLASDALGNIYVADSGNQRVLVFAPGATEPFLTLDDSGWYPTGVAVSNDGEVAVTNNTSQGSLPGSVTFFKRGHSNVFREFDGALFAFPYFCAYDAQGKLYLDAVSIGGRTGVFEVARDARSGTIKSLGIRNIRFPGAVQVDDNGKLLVLDQYSSTIFTYVPPSRQPKGTLKLTGAGDAVTFALISNDKALYVADQQYGTVLLYPFPAGGSPTQQITVGGLPLGIAVTPWSAP